MLIIRLQRTGKRNAADFRIVLAEKEAPVQKKFHEVLGSYNPRKKAFQIKQDRVQYWISQRVAMSPTVHNLFVTQGVLQGSKVKAYSVPKKAEEPKAEAPAPEAAPAAEAPAEAAAPADVSDEASAKPEEAKAE